VGSGFPAAQQQQLQPRPFFGRGEELEKFKSIAASLTGLPRLTAIKGIAGIGYAAPFSQMYTAAFPI
jgi:hypothetical protein